MDQLAPSRPEAEAAAPPPAAPRADPLPSPAADTAARPGWRTRLIMFGLPLALVAGGAGWWLLSGGSVSTDNAYVQMDKVSVAAEVGGRITEVAVRDGEQVAKGQLLFRIDSEPYALNVAQATAAIDAARVEVGNLAAGANTSAVEIAAAREEVRFAQVNFERQAALMEKGFTTRAAYDASRHALAQARERVRQAEAAAVEARTRLAAGPASGINPQVEAARVQRAQAEVNLARTSVRAPSAGRVAQADRLQVGQAMVAGLPALTLVDTAHPWVEANFKETDLADMRVGQRAEIRFDAYPGLKVRGHVLMIGAGTGSEFSVLPAQNATGNWVKVTQRVPVRIAFDEKPARDMIAGLSAEVTVFTGGGTVAGK
ncbi:HlyD family secretion protein [Sphingopyxis alaskensis]|jgi:membrane fusion protein (multidrug efflux system)|uniref:Secretion protein HlyD n=1 Tax=Sphingopyxis alaskensis (strain DSM 13593 / LMG 18877 / RB2256) TaxID=317655 RepID=Q1GRD1_SPHAL|nr:HlyD family secretion protein [Sphingopyxis alaskensis]ABF53791.1 secretion protein HlyD [Sphingopyxis alaskensis RB2256]MCM3419471.1 HlyD family secretion protein [Sphingopyxis alaskensis]